MNTNLFVERLKRIRFENGLSQKDFAKKIGIASASLSAYENGRNIPSGQFLASISETFGVSVDWLLGLNQDHFNEFSTFSDCLKQLSKLIEMGMAAPGASGSECFSVAFCPEISKGLNEISKLQDLRKLETIDIESYKMFLAAVLNKYDKPIKPEIDHDNYKYFKKQENPCSDPEGAAKASC